ncbi:GLUT4 regulating protein TUG-domain-containing protein [Astrocystis sublimbata]|nr:GLUT4 regulating protein TUG-domain-containing protein [Astrocystis sublimbata]
MMATNVKVVGTDLRQVTIKVNPGTYLTDILEQACTKLKVSNDKYLLKHKQRQLDLSQTFRTSGLIPGARLELVRRANTPTVVNVALQLPSPESGAFPPHGRVSEKLPSDFTIWQILRQFESGKASAGKNLNLTARGIPQISNGTQAGSGQLYYEIPNVIIEKRTLSTFVDFQKTLSQLGYNSGGVLMRLSFQKTEKLLSDAMSEIQEYFKTDEKDDEPQKTGDAGADEMSASTSEPSALPSEADSAAPDVSVADPSVAVAQDPQSTTNDNDSLDADIDMDSLSGPGPRPMTIFSAPTTTTPVAALRPDTDEDYAPDISHAKAHQKLLNSLGQNKRLLSDPELEEKAAAEEARVAAVKAIKIKVRFPDNFSAEWTFGPDDTGAGLYREVRGIMANGSASFRLVLPGARTVIKDDASSTLIKGYRLNSNTLVNFIWDDDVTVDVRRQPFLKSSAVEQAKQVVVPEVREVEAKQEGPSISTQAPTPRNDGGEGSGFKKPKWLKGFGKK